MCDGGGGRLTDEICEQNAKPGIFQMNPLIGCWPRNHSSLASPALLFSRFFSSVITPNISNTNNNVDFPNLVGDAKSYQIPKI